MRVRPIDAEKFQFGRTASTLRRFTDERAAIEAARIHANAEGEGVDVYFRKAPFTRPTLFRRIEPGEALDSAAGGKSPQ
jgi:hypothetical protein